MLKCAVFQGSDATVCVCVCMCMYSTLECRARCVFLPGDLADGLLYCFIPTTWTSCQLTLSVLAGRSPPVPGSHSLSFQPCDTLVR